VDIDPKIQLALRHLQSDRAVEAENLCRQLLSSQPGNAQALQLLGQIAHQAGRNAEAVELMRRVLETDPGNPYFRGNLGAVLAAGGRFAEAEAELREGLRLKPDFVEGYSNLGNILLQQGKVEDAIAVYRTAARLRPRAAESFYNLGAALQRARRWNEAIAVYQQAIALKPDHAEAFNNLGSIHSENGRLDEGITAFRQALRFQPRHLHAMNNLAAGLQEKGGIEEAIATYRRALQIKTDPRVAGNLIISMHLRPEDDPKVIRAEVDRWNEIYAKPLAARRRLHGNAPDPEKRLRVGYVSRDFNRAPVGRFMVPILANHDHSRFEVFAYSDVLEPDAVTERLRGTCDHWNDVASLNDAQLAERVTADGIDVLVDLGMHTKGSRILVFAMKPAPVQISYLAYCSTTGLETMDYRFTDPYLDPRDRDSSLYSEQSVRLTSYWCYAAPAEAPAVAPPPFQTSGFVTFGCLNNFCKISPPAFDTWCDLLSAVPHSRLMVHALEGTHRDQAVTRMKSAGIDQSRIQFVNRLPVAQYLRQYNQIDIALDPFPYPGGTTSCDALWMGVPLVTLAGRTAVARGGVSILSNSGLPDLIAHSREQYLQNASALARDRSRLASLRASIRGRMQSSPLMDGPRFTREMQAAFREMWRTWCGTRGKDS
jgi:predicted O-linked N-acetylglucosamine transferase (SPINDLY family)